MGNKATSSVASAAGLAMAKSQLKSFTGENDSETEGKKAKEALSQATLKKLSDQRKEREKELAKRKAEREKKVAMLSKKWNKNENVTG